MKFVLVINLADDVAEAYEDFTVDYDLRGRPKEDGFYTESIKYVEDAKIRPLPQKMKHEDEIDYEYGYIDGRNELIDEILGETE